MLTLKKIYENNVICIAISKKNMPMTVKEMKYKGFEKLISFLNTTNPLFESVQIPLKIMFENKFNTLIIPLPSEKLIPFENEFQEGFIFVDNGVKNYLTITKKKEKDDESLKFKINENDGFLTKMVKNGLNHLSDNDDEECPFCGVSNCSCGSGY